MEGYLTSVITYSWYSATCILTSRFFATRRIRMYNNHVVLFCALNTCVLHWRGLTLSTRHANRFFFFCIFTPNQTIFLVKFLVTQIRKIRLMQFVVYSIPLRHIPYYKPTNFNEFSLYLKPTVVTTCILDWS